MKLLLIGRSVWCHVPWCVPAVCGVLSAASVTNAWAGDIREKWLAFQAVGGVAPQAAGDTLYVDTNTPYNDSPYTIAADDTFDTVYDGFSGTGVINHTAGTLTVTNDVFLGDNAGSNGTYNLSGTGNLTAATLTAGYNGVGTFNQSGSGNTTLSNALVLGNFTGSSGTYNLTGTGTLTAPVEYIGYNAGSTFTQSSGTNAASNAGSGAFYVGYNAGGNGNYTLSGTGTLTADLEIVGNSGTGMFTQTGGTHTVSGFLALGFNGTGDNATNNSNGTYALSGTAILSTGGEAIGEYGNGTFTQSSGTNTIVPTYNSSGMVTDGVTLGANSSSSGIYHLDGGTLQTPTLLGSSGQGGTSTFDFNGGLLQANADISIFLGGLTSAKVQAGGAIIDSNGHNITVFQVLSHDPALGAIVDGGLTKLGAGTMTILLNNTYTGPTNINGGTLLVFGAQTNTGLITVNGTDATLGGYGPLSAPVNVVVGSINPGDNSGASGSEDNVGSLVTGALTLRSTATAVFDVFSKTEYDQLMVTGNASLNGTLTLHLDASTTFNPGDTLDLIHASGALSGMFTGVTNGGTYIYDGQAFQAEYTPTDFELVAVPEASSLWWSAGALVVCGATVGRRMRRAC